MSTFPLRVGTPDGLLYEGDVARVVCRTISGDLAILPGHAFHDERGLPCPGNNLGVGRGY